MDSTDSCVIAVDAGTTGVRGRAVFVDGRPAVASYKEFTQNFPQPGWVEHITKQLDGVPKVRQEELIHLTARVFVTARKRELAKSGATEEVTVEDIVRPLTPRPEANTQP